jgi:hypothetical protein
MKESKDNSAVSSKIQDIDKEIDTCKSKGILKNLLHFVTRIILIVVGIWLLYLIDTYSLFLKEYDHLFWAMLPLWVLVAILIIVLRRKKLRFLDYAVIAVITIDMYSLAAVYGIYRANKVICFSNIRAIGDSLEPYSYENDGFLPSVESWRESLKQTFPEEVDESSFSCPLVVFGPSECQFNRNVAGLKFSEIPDGTVLIYVCVPYGSICDMYESDQETTKSCLSSEEQCYLYVKGDYTIKFVKPDEMAQWRWKP